MAFLALFFSIILITNAFEASSSAIMRDDLREKATMLRALNTTDFSNYFDHTFVATVASDDTVVTAKDTPAYEIGPEISEARKDGSSFSSRRGNSFFLTNYSFAYK